jgi:hypothetical protein
MLNRVVGVLLAGLAFGSAICVAGLYLRSRGSGRFLWALVALVGIVRWDLIWDTGQILSRPASFVVLTVAVGRNEALDSWMLSFSIPVGAMVAYQRWRLRVVRDDADAPPPG